MLANIFKKIIALSNLPLSLPDIISLPLHLSLLSGITPLSPPFLSLSSLNSGQEELLPPPATSHPLSLLLQYISHWPLISLLPLLYLTYKYIGAESSRGTFGIWMGIFKWFREPKCIFEVWRAS